MRRFGDHRGRTGRPDRRLQRQRRHGSGPVVVEFGDTKELPELHCRQCLFGCRIILKEWDKRKLYCAVYETWENNELKTHKQYLHAITEPEAKKFFWAQYSPFSVHLVAIAPVIGFFAKSEKDDRNLVV